jgi:hypothetical protein
VFAACVWAVSLEVWLRFWSGVGEVGLVMMLGSVVLLVSGGVDERAASRC